MTMDVLTDWIREIETNAVVLCRTTMPAPWGMQILAREGVMFHIARKGSCWLRRKGHPPLRLSEGDLVLLPLGLDHEIVDDPASVAIPLEDFLAKESFQLNGNAVTTLICGVYLADVSLAHPMLLALPPVMHFAAPGIVPSLPPRLPCCSLRSRATPPAVRRSSSISSTCSLSTSFAPGPTRSARSGRAGSPR